MFITCCLIVTVGQWLWSQAFGFDPFTGRGDSNRFLVASAPFFMFFLPGSALLDGKWIADITPAHWIIGAVTWGIVLYSGFGLLFTFDARLRKVFE